MSGLKDIFVFCIGSGVITVCIILVVSGILRWIGTNGVTRTKRLNILAWIAAVVLLSVSLLYFFRDLGDNKALALLKMSGKLFAALILVVLATSAVVLLVIIAIYLYNVLWALTHTENGSDIQNGKEIRKKNEDKILNNFVQILKSPTVVSAISLGIIALFLIFPLLAGLSGVETSGESNSVTSDKIDEGTNNEIDKEADDKTNETIDDKAGRKADNLIDIWTNGLSNISRTFNNEGDDDNKPTRVIADPFATYALIYIVVLGVGFAAFKILYSIITQSLEKKTHKELIGEYSNPIGLLAVGVSVLWSLKGGNLSGKDEFEIVFELLKSFAVVTIIVTLVILILEVIRLLIDMREFFLRQEGRYLFITLVGECAIMVINVMFTFCGSLTNAIGGKEDMELIEFEDEVIQKMIKFMKNQLNITNNPPVDKQLDNSNNQERTFEVFDQKTTEKRKVG